MEEARNNTLFVPERCSACAFPYRDSSFASPFLASPVLVVCNVSERILCWACRRAASDLQRCDQHGSFHVAHGRAGWGNFNRLKLMKASCMPTVKPVALGRSFTRTNILLESDFLYLGDINTLRRFSPCIDLITTQLAPLTPTLLYLYKEVRERN